MEIKSDECISVSSVYELKDQYFDQDQTKDDSRLKILTESIFHFKESENRNHKLIIKDIGELRENYKMIENYVGCYRMYSISFIEDFSKPIIKCYRRFSHFDLFLTKIKMSYPYILIPQSPLKNPLTKIRLVEEQFFEEREKRIIFIINFINENEILCKSKEFHKLINDFEFDFNYFSTLPTFKFETLFPETDKQRKEKHSSYFGFLNNLL